MVHNFLVQTLAKEKINENVEVIIEDNIGECIHVHFRINNGFDVRMDFKVNEFKNFCLLLNWIIETDGNTVMGV